MVARLLFGNYPKASPLEEAHHFPAAGDARDTVAKEKRRYEDGLEDRAQ